MRTIFFSSQSFEEKIFTNINSNYNLPINFVEQKLNPLTAHLAKDFNAVCCFVNDEVNSEVINILSSHNIKLIALRSAGFNNVDYNYAKTKEIAVCRVPEYSPHAVAEHALALILSLNRKTHRAFNRVREGNFALTGLMGFDLYGKTVGVIGTGKIGSVFAKIMQGIGCNVIAFDPNPNQECINMGIKYTSLDELIKHANIISLHCPLSEQTRHIIDANKIAKMRDGVMLINTSRGKLLDTKAIVNALKSQKIGYLGLDVYEEENLFFVDHSYEIMQDELFARLMTFPNVLITGHQAFFTQEAVQNIANTTLNNIKNFFNKSGKVELVY